MKIKVSYLRKIIREVLEEETQKECSLEETDGESGKGVESDTDDAYHDKNSNRNLEKDTQYDRK
jgi:hypothetical protein